MERRASSASSGSPVAGGDGVSRDVLSADRVAATRALGHLLAPVAAAEQPPWLDLPRAELNAAIGSLALGGAERIVLDWAARAAGRHRVRLVVLRDTREEWAPPPGVEVIRLHGADIDTRLRDVGATCVGGGNPIVLCHLLTAAEREALARGGARPIPVLHNARAGWIEPARALSGASHVIAVSRAAVDELRAAGCRLPCLVIRHLPRPRAGRPDARLAWRARWAVPADAFVVGMIGGVKPQKGYPRALRVLAALLETHLAYLVIIGGPAGRDGMLAWRAVLAQALRLGVAPFLRLPGGVADAARCLPAFDVFLNTSRYEGVSVATLEALAAGLPVVASRVGGQGEVPAPGLTLRSFDAPDADWAEAIVAAQRPAPPAWRGFPTDRTWTLAHLAAPFAPRAGVVFVTANLNAGGAQRSLTNLALALRARLPLEVAVCGGSSADAFSRALRERGVRLYRTAGSRDGFDHAEALVRRIVAGRLSVVCFWNVDPKVKLLVVKTLAPTPVAFVDVSPGAFAFEEMRATGPFQAWIGFSEGEYYARLDRLVLKYRAALPDGIRARTATIPNGVPWPARVKTRFDPLVPRVVVSGRIAPSKFVLEAVAAMRLLWSRFPRAELHVLGWAEARHAPYAEAVLRAAGLDADRRVRLRGVAFDAPDRLADYDVALVLGEHQGCPNAALEALAAGVPVVATDSGGTRELVIDGVTGLLLPRPEPDAIAAALARLCADPRLASRLALAGRAHVARRFSMPRMADAYVEVFGSVSRRRVGC